MNAERRRLRETEQGAQPWRLWGPYLSERQWGTVREDYSAQGTAWDYFPHEHARSRAYRWGEDGIAGVCDEQQRICFSVAFWNGSDPILKERLFGLTGSEGNHGEDVKEVYYYLDNTPTHSYMKMLYRYPQTAFPYARLAAENARRSRLEPEYELFDTGVFDDGRYFDLFIEYAKAAPEDILVRITAHNRGPDPARLHVLPQIWFRNRWSWSRGIEKPRLWASGDRVVALREPSLGDYYLVGHPGPELLFCENETNLRRLFGVAGGEGWFKDGIHDYVVGGMTGAVNPERRGTKAALHYRLSVAPDQPETILLRLSAHGPRDPATGAENIFCRRIREADEFYEEILSRDPSDQELQDVRRLAYAGLLWSKQFYEYDVSQWLKGDELQPSPPEKRRRGRNADWLHLNNADVLSMPDKWEYPWYAAWDLAFHCLPLTVVDPEFAKHQLVLLTREGYMHPNGQLPAYEWAFGEVNPPVHAWAAWRVYEIDRDQNSGRGDLDFLERVFHKLLLNFTWWVNRKDADGRNVFQGGFLGLDNITVFDRSGELPTGGHIEQSDATSWMAMYSLNLMRIALELSLHRPIYQDIATKFFEHFLLIARAMTDCGCEGLDLWDEQDEFFYDILHPAHTPPVQLKVRSLVGLIPLFAVEILEPDFLERVPEFTRRLEWILAKRPEWAALVSRWYEPGVGERRLLSLLRGHRMKALLRRALDPDEFLSPYGIRSLSRYHLEHPYAFRAGGRTFRLSYEPAESQSGLFGGNSNWRGPIWFPLNFLIVESLLKFHRYYGDDFRIECPTGSGRLVTIREVAEDLAVRLRSLFLRNPSGIRPADGHDAADRRDPNLRDPVLFYEYFDGDSGKGLGASHQTGWTGLMAML